MLDAVYSVDVFLFLGGFFAAMCFLASRRSLTGRPIFYVQSVLGRACRLLPAYLFVLGLYANLMPLLGSGPIWESYMQVGLGCLCSESSGGHVAGGVRCVSVLVQYRHSTSAQGHPPTHSL